MIKATVRRWALLMLLAVLPATAAALPLPRDAAVPGGIAVVPIGGSGNAVPQAHYNGKRVMVLRDDDGWVAVVGLSLSAAVGRHNLRIHHGPGRDSSATFTVSARQYAEQRLTIENKRMVNPSAEDLKRIAGDQAISREAYATFRPLDTVPIRFVLPVEGRLSSPFGLRRYFNGEARNPHSGLDLAAPTGTPVRAPAAGRIIASGNFFFNGNTVFLDHGQGLVSMYCHLDSIAVHSGQILRQGESLGTVGMTGRVTGPHLHWSVSLNDSRIDPMLFLAPDTIARLNP